MITRSSSLPKTNDDAQTKKSHELGSIWNAVRLADVDLVSKILKEDPKHAELRGPVGELPLHMSVLYNTPKHRELSRWFMKAYPHLITRAYEGELYGGENILHMAIIQKDAPFVQELLAASKQLLEGQVKGDFFKIGGSCYYGEYPISFTVSTGQLSLFNILLSHGANIDCTDANGNTLLHLAVIHSRTTMYAEVKKAWLAQYPTWERDFPPKSDDDNLTRFRPLWQRKNGRGLTPYSLAADLGNLRMFSFLMEEGRQLQWKYGPVTCICYPLDDLDTPMKRAKDHSLSCLELIVLHGHLSLVMYPRMRELVNAKWARFVHRIFITRFVLYLIYLAVFTSTVIYHSTLIAESEAIAAAIAAAAADTADALSAASVSAGDAVAGYGATELLSESLSTLVGGSASVNVNVESDSVMNVAAAAVASAALNAVSDSVSVGDDAFSVNVVDEGDPFCPSYFVYAGYFIVVMGAVFKAWFEYKEMKRRGVHHYFFLTSGSAFLENIVSCTFCASLLLTTVIAPFSTSFARTFLAVASVSAYAYLLFFLLAFRLTGPMVVMIFTMLTNDVLRFCLVFAVFMAGFSQAFYVLLESRISYLHSIKASFMMALGDFDIDEFSQNTYSYLTICLLVAYLILITILLINLLIAMMGSTYSSVNDHAEQVWHLERARILCEIENGMSSRERRYKSNQYWTWIEGKRYLQAFERDDKWFYGNLESKSSVTKSDLCKECKTRAIEGAGEGDETENAVVSVVENQVNDVSDNRPATIKTIKSSHEEKQALASANDDNDNDNDNDDDGPPPMVAPETYGGPLSSSSSLSLSSSSSSASSPSSSVDVDVPSNSSDRPQSLNTETTSTSTLTLTPETKPKSASEKKQAQDDDGEFVSNPLVAALSPSGRVRSAVAALNSSILSPSASPSKSSSNKNDNNNSGSNSKSNSNTDALTDSAPAPVPVPATAPASATSPSPSPSPTEHEHEHANEEARHRRHSHAHSHAHSHSHSHSHLHHGACRGDADGTCACTEFQRNAAIHEQEQCICGHAKTYHD